MSLVKHHIVSLVIQFETLTAPPPFSHHYQITLDLSVAQPILEFEINYSDREQLSEEEILEEGFTLEDDYTWKGELPKAWKFATLDLLRKSKNLFDEPKPHVQQILRISITYENGEQWGGIPNNTESWEYFAQEMIQAIYEISQKELPLEINYLEVSSQQKQVVTIKPSFSYRKVRVERKQPGEEHQKEYEWGQLKPLLEAIYLPDYDSEQASSKEPRKQGNYISPGDGLWYELGKAVTNPGEKKDAVSEMQERSGML